MFVSDFNEVRDGRGCSLVNVKVSDLKEIRGACECSSVVRGFCVILRRT